MNKGYLYLMIPIEYYCIYNKLLKLLSNLGLDMLNDCASSCKGDSKNIIKCWQMFQTACAAYTINNIKQSDTIIKYINKQLNLGCEEIIRKDKFIVYHGDCDIIPNIDYIKNGDKIDFSDINIFDSSYFKEYHYIAIPEHTNIKVIENINFSGDYLYNVDTDDDYYTRQRILIDDKPYLLWYCKLNQPLNTLVKINMVNEDWFTDNNIYYGECTTIPSINDILNGNKKDFKESNTLSIEVNEIGHYIVLPKNLNLFSSENANFKEDYLYHILYDINMYTIKEITMNNNKYNLYYCIFNQSINSVIDIILN